MIIIICDNNKKNDNNSECVALIFYIKDVDNEYNKTTNFFRRISFL